MARREPLTGYWKRISNIQMLQTDKGLKKYGLALEDNKLEPTWKRIQHIEEELIDGLMYLEWLKESLAHVATTEDYDALENENSMLKEELEHWKEKHPNE